MISGDAGFLSEPVKFLDAKSTEARELATRVLSSMISGPKNRKRFMPNQENIGLLVQLLDREAVQSFRIPENGAEIWKLSSDFSRFQPHSKDFPAAVLGMFF
ncbi:hypothetical protein POM88_024646 [Heracleum sosnowskyi]|uniref:Uncharacterized protein n=1 Tax=Heracleum sosnowskyi TaxID=360622 RepID=A0AAD8I2F9_9APIA|nr:hypothetical protein POM88_024646 [Heracleum sosnowskyi]